MSEPAVEATETTSSMEDTATSAAADTEPVADDHPNEAKRYRLQLRETERERDELRERLAGYERREVEAVARELGYAVPQDVWVLAALDDFRLGDGALDLEAARKRLSGILTERPTWRMPMPDLGAGARAGTPEPAATLGLSSLLRSR